MLSKVLNLNSKYSFMYRKLENKNTFDFNI